MKEEIITKILDSYNLFELADRLEEFLKFVKSIRKSKNDIFYELYEPLSSWYFDCSFYSKDPYIIFEGNEGVKLYLKNRWQFCNSYRKNSECLLAVIIEIHEKIICSQGPGMTSEDIKSLINALEANFSFVEKITNRTCIEIAIFNHSHACWNNFASISTADNNRYYRIMATHVRKESCHSEYYSFLHELGHILHAALTNSFDLMPIGFAKIQKTMFNQRKTPLSNQEMCELFADCFAMAAIYRLNFKKHDPHDMILDKDKAIMAAYITALIKSIKI